MPTTGTPVWSSPSLPARISSALCSLTKPFCTRRATFSYVCASLLPRLSPGSRFGHQRVFRPIVGAINLRG